MFPPSCVRVHTSHEMNTHKKTLSTHRCFFKKCFCTYFIHVVQNTFESWQNVVQQKFYAHADFKKLEGTFFQLIVFPSSCITISCCCCSVDFNLDTIRINVCIQYLLTIFDFFAEPLSEFSRNSSPSATPLKKPAQKTSSSYGELPVPPPPPVTETVLPPVSEALTVRARFKQLEVVLFADPTDKHSRVLVLKAS